MLELTFFAIFLIMGMMLRGTWLQPIITHLRRERDDLKGELSSVKTARELLVTKIHSLRAEISERKKQLDHNWGSLQREISQSCKLEDLLKRAKVQRDKLKTNLDEMQASHDILFGNNQDFVAANNALKTKLSEREAFLDLAVAGAKEENDTLREKLAVFQEAAKRGLL